MKILEKDLPLFPLRTVLFPQARVPLQIFEPRYIEMIERCLQEDLAFGILLIKSGDEVGPPAVPHEVGTVARIIDVARLDDGRMNIAAAGITRFKLLKVSAELAYLTGRVEIWRDEDVDIAKAEKVARRAALAFQNYIRAIENVAAVEPHTREEKTFRPPKDPTVLSYLIASNLHVSQSDKQSLLETPTVLARLRREIALMGREVELIRLVSEKSDRILDQGTFSLN
ncbi:MAG: LON peptidase substrate-binding domain-containing protein [Chloroflexi bacterium]|nr:LON peptidase substrate-binding domain-containing protein [Chloroflexota bacterium]